MSYVFIDIDGTLFSHRLKEIPASAMDALAQLKNKGHKVFICTGRALSSCKDFYHLDVDGWVFSAGAVAYAERKRIFQSSFTEDQVQEVSSLVEECNLGLLLEADAGTYQNEMAKQHNAHYIEESYKAIDLEQAFFEHRMYPLDYRDPRDPVFKICVYGEDREAFARFQAALPKTYHGIIMNGEVDTPRIGMELTLKNINKSTAAKQICEYYGASLQEAVAIGDSLNDFEIVRDAGIGIAMGNAHEDLKKVANYITEDVAEDGLFNAFKHFELI